MNNFLNKLIAITIFISSFLLFLIQPLIGKFLLPYFGGNSYVWIISVSFFTSFLFLAYLYAFLLAKINIKKQLIFHFLFLSLISFFHFFNSFNNNWLSPIFPNNLESQEASVSFVLFTLFISIGLLFLILASTNTILQNWYGIINKKKSPYYLYAISNIGSILGLFSYPLFFEIYYGNIKQSNIWSSLFVLYLACFILIILFVSKLIKNFKKEPVIKEEIQVSQTKFYKLPLFSWFIYASLPVAYYLIISDTLSRGVASFPLIWILPLFFYLLSFVFAFKLSFKKLKLELALFILFLFFFNFIFESSINTNLFFSVLVNNLLVFFIALFCHSNLYDSRPKNIKFLPSFYLFISLGGAIASVFISLLVPRIFNNYFELPLVIYLFLAISIYYFALNHKTYLKDFKLKFSYKAASYLIIFWLLITSLVINTQNLFKLSGEETYRSYFGVLKIVDHFRPVDDKIYKMRTLYHGNISHGHEVFLFENSGKSSYYSKISGLGIAYEFLKNNNDSIYSAMIGLGAGMAADYNRENDKMVFYEIDQAVIDLAYSRFNYLNNAKGEVDVLLGDARLVLEGEKKRNYYDLLAVDAFSDNAIPVHLLSYEAYQVYKDRIKNNGVIAYHISNRYLDIEKVLIPLCYKHKLDCALINNSSVYSEFISGSSWFIISKNKDFINYLENYEQDNVNIRFIDKNIKTRYNYFSDDYNNIITILKF